MELYGLNFEKKENLQLVKGLYGSEFDKNRSCAFCKYHHCHLTVKQVKQHECLKKQCYYLNKNEEHSWWKQREVIKQRKKAKRMNGDNYYA